MKRLLLNHCILNKEARLYDFISATNVIVTDKIPTMGVNKKARLYINKSFYEENISHIIGLLLHESLHIFLDHINAEYENHRIANIAQDIIINDLVLSKGYTLPDSACTYESLNVLRSLKTSYDIYQYLIQNEPPQEIDPDHSLPDDDDFEEGDIEEIERLAKIIAENIEYEKRAAVAQEYKLDQKPLLIRSINQILGKVLQPEFERSYTRPSRFRNSSVIMPSSRSIVRKPTLSIYLDVSGSMEGSNIEKSLGILEDIKNMMKAYTTKRYVFNTDTYEINDYKDVEVGGGTKFDDFHSSDNSDVVIVITDCEFSFDFLSYHNRKKVIIITLGQSQLIDNCEVFAA